MPPQARHHGQGLSMRRTPAPGPGRWPHGDQSSGCISGGRAPLGRQTSMGCDPGTHAAASRRSIVRLYFWRTRTTRSANQHGLRSGTHAAASRSFFCPRFTSGLARVRFRRSVAKRRRADAAHGPRLAAVAAHNPLSCASDRATICSMSVSRRLANVRPVYGLEQIGPQGSR